MTGPMILWHHTASTGLRDKPRRGELVLLFKADWAVRLLLCIASVFCCGAHVAQAHDIPADVRINAFLKPAGDRLELLVRVPLAAMQEVDIPVRGPGYLDISRADDALRHAAKIWLSDNFEI